MHAFFISFCMIFFHSASQSLSCSRTAVLPTISSEQTGWCKSDHKQTVEKQIKQDKLPIWTLFYHNAAEVEFQLFTSEISYDGTFKVVQRYHGYISTHLQLPTHKKSTTTLSEHVWNLKNNNIEHCISWEIIENSHPYNTASKKCNLCTAEKYFILTGKPTLNKRREIFAQCPHRRKHLLQNIRDSSTARQSLQRP